MELRQVRYVLAVVDAGTFSAAARNLNIVQSAVSQQVARLERELGTQLFDRTSRTPRLTAAGQRFVPAAQRLLDAEAAVRESVTEVPTGRRLRLGVTGGLDRLVSRLEGPVDAISVSAAERQARVVDGELDAAIVHGTGVRSGLLGLPIRPDRVVIVTARDHPASSPGPLRLADLQPFTMLLGDDAVGTALAETVVRACRAVGFEPRITTIPSGQSPFSSITSGQNAWTVFYEDQSQLFDQSALRVRFHTPADAQLEVPTTVVVRTENAELGAELVRTFDSAHLSS